MNKAITSRLRAGDRVQVEEIQNTLDADGRLDELPFTPEMLPYCGRKMRVGKRVHKTCDLAIGIGARKMENTVHLENSRCDGSAHDGCETACLIFWKEAWLKRADDDCATLDAGSSQNGACPGAHYAQRIIYGAFQRLMGATPYPIRPYGLPKGVAVPRAQLDLQPGERVRVPYAEMLKTSDSNYRNRGLYFDPEMVPFTEREYEVDRRQKQIIDERNWKNGPVQNRCDHSEGCCL
jgi:hypothetical protein